MSKAQSLVLKHLYARHCTWRDNGQRAHSTGPVVWLKLLNFYVNWQGFDALKQQCARMIELSYTLKQTCLMQIALQVEAGPA